MAGDKAAPPRRPLTLEEVEPGSENERLGVARDSMLCNPLILKPEVGKPQRNCYTLPGLDFAYGLHIQRTDGGVPEAIGGWQAAEPRGASARSLPRDFLAMTRGALRAGCTTAKDFNLYYRARDVRRKGEEYSHLQRSPPSLPADFTFGIPPRPSTPMWDLLQHKYKELWMEQQRALTAAQRAAKKKRDKVRDTRGTLPRREPAPAKEPSWHLPRLEKVGPHPSSFPVHGAHKKAASASH